MTLTLLRPAEATMAKSLVREFEVCLFIPMRLVAKVKRGRVYLCEITRNLRRPSE